MWVGGQKRVGIWGISLGVRSKVRTVFKNKQQIAFQIDSCRRAGMDHGSEDINVDPPEFTLSKAAAVFHDFIPPESTFADVVGAREPGVVEIAG